LPPDIPDKEFKIGNWDGWFVIALITIGFLLSIFFASIFTISKLKKSRQSDYQITGRDKNFVKIKFISFIFYRNKCFDRSISTTKIIRLSSDYSKTY